MNVNLKLLFQGHVPVFLSDHVLVKAPPAGMVVPSGMVISAKKVESLQPTAPNVAVGLGPGVPVVVGERITTGATYCEIAFVPVGLTVAVGVMDAVEVLVALGLAAAVWLNCATIVCAAEV